MVKNDFDSSMQNEWTSPEAAEHWKRQAAEREQVMGRSTQLMLIAAGVQRGSRILDIAAGTGDQSLAAARMAGPTGLVLATDISISMLRIAAEAAKQEGLTNVFTKEMDASDIDLEPESFDAVISQHGLMFIPDLQSALTNIHRVLRPAGKFAALVWSKPENNPAFSIPMSIVMRAVGLSSSNLSNSGIFSLSDPDGLTLEFQDAGFRDVLVQTVPRVYRATSAEAFLTARLASSSGAMTQALAKLSDHQRQSVLEEIIHALTPFEGPNGFEAPSESILIQGSK